MAEAEEQLGLAQSLNRRPEDIPEEEAVSEYELNSDDDDDSGVQIMSASWAEYGVGIRAWVRGVFFGFLGIALEKIDVRPFALKRHRI
jgi:hypothetical protein